MSKDELIKNLEVTNQLICQIEEADLEYAEYHREHQMSTFLVFLGSFVMMVTMLVVVSSAYRVFKFESFLIGLVSFAIVVFLPVITMVSLSLIMRKRKREITIEKNKLRIQEIEINVSQWLDLLEQNTILPENYRYSFASENIYGYLINLRADTLKEALNLFEEELRHQEQMSAINIIREDQLAIFNEVRRNSSAINTANALSWANLIAR